MPARILVVQALVEGDAAPGAAGELRDQRIALVLAGHRVEFRLGAEPAHQQDAADGRALGRHHQTGQLQVGQALQVAPPVGLDPDLDDDGVPHVVGAHGLDPRIGPALDGSEIDQERSGSGRNPRRSAAGRSRRCPGCGRRAR